MTSIRNRASTKSTEDGGNRIPSDISLRGFAEAVASFDLDAVPHHRRKEALRAHVLKIVSMRAQDKNLADAIQQSYLAHLAASQPKH